MSGPGYAPNTNIAIPEQRICAINNINNALRRSGIRRLLSITTAVQASNTMHMVPLEALITTIPCETYQIKTIADAILS